METKEKIRKAIANIFNSEEEDWEEGEVKEIDNVLINYTIEDNAGSFRFSIAIRTIPPFEEGDPKDKERYYLGFFKVSYYGRPGGFGGYEKGQLYYNLNEDNLYTSKEPFNSYEESKQLLTERVLQLL